MNTWIKRTEREPQPDEFPVLAGYYLGGHDKWNEYRCTVSQQLGSATHWRSIKCDPPARELTQRERDDAAANAASYEAYRLDADKPEAISISSARRAIYAERREVAKLMAENYADLNWGINEPMVSSYSRNVRQLRARLDEQGAK